MTANGLSSPGRLAGAWRRAGPRRRAPGGAAEARQEGAQAARPLPAGGDALRRGQRGRALRGQRAAPPDVALRCGGRRHCRRGWRKGGLPAKGLSRRCRRRSGSRALMCAERRIPQGVRDGLHAACVWTPPAGSSAKPGWWTRGPRRALLPTCWSWDSRPKGLSACGPLPCLCAVGEWDWDAARIAGCGPLPDSSWGSRSCTPGQAASGAARSALI